MFPGIKLMVACFLHCLHPTRIMLNFQRNFVWGFRIIFICWDGGRTDRGGVRIDVWLVFSFLLLCAFIQLNFYKISITSDKFIVMTPQFWSVWYLIWSSGSYFQHAHTWRVSYPRRSFRLSPPLHKEWSCSNLY